MFRLPDDVAVVEVSSFVASPTAGLYMAQMGADVIRVDQIGGGQGFAPLASHVCTTTHFLGRI